MKIQNKKEDRKQRTTLSMILYFYKKRLKRLNLFALTSSHKNRQLADTERDVLLFWEAISVEES